jgi:kinetochore protein Mis13/DSN1
MDPAFRFPVPGSGATAINGVSGKKKKVGKEKERGKEKDSFDTIEELSKGDTPQMERNKLMRAAHSRPPSHSNSHSQSDTDGPSTDNGRVGGKKEGKVGQNTTNRKSSGSTRGKRVSSLFEGGIICKSSSPPCILF